MIYPALPMTLSRITALRPMESRVRVGGLFVFSQGPDCILKMLRHLAVIYADRGSSSKRNGRVDILFRSTNPVDGLASIRVSLAQLIYRGC